MPSSAARLLNSAAATLAVGVLTDSAAEHYRAEFHHPAMFVAPAISAAALAAATASAVTRRHPAVGTAIFAASVATGLVGVGFHLSNVSRRVGGFGADSVFHGAPIAAPLAITIAGIFGLAAPRLTNRAATTSAALAGVSAVGLVGTSIEAGALHFRGAFQHRAMYAPVALPPIAATALAVAAVTRSPRSRTAARALLGLTSALGIAGVAFHARGVQRRMGGWNNWRQNVLAGPPLPAPPAFMGLALAGLAALRLIESEPRE